MTDLEHTLGPQLHRLADELAPDADPLDQVGGARSRYRRQRRNRVGLTALAVAVAAVVIGVPVTLGSVSSAPRSGDVAGPGSVTTPVQPTVRPEQTSLAEAQAQLAAIAANRAAASAASAAATGGDAAAETLAEEAAHRAAAQARQAEVVARLDAPVRLTAPPADGSCPDGVATLSRATGHALALMTDSRLTGGPTGCAWFADATMMSQVTVGMRFLPGATADQVQAEFSTAVNIQCSTVAVPPVGPQAVLQSCDAGNSTQWYLELPDTSGSGIWVLDAEIGIGLVTPTGGDGLTAVIALAEATWGA